jgi:uncharacterized membrane protein YkoI
MPSGEVVPPLKTLAELTYRQKWRILEVELEEDHGTRVYELAMVYADGWKRKLFLVPVRESF